MVVDNSRYFSDFPEKESFLAHLKKKYIIFSRKFNLLRDTLALTKLYFYKKSESRDVKKSKYKIAGPGP